MKDPDFVSCTGRLSGTLVNNTLLTKSHAVGAKERWKLTEVTAHNGDDVTRVVTISIVDASNNVVHEIAQESLAAGDHMTDSNPHWLESGYKIQITWAAGGASAGGTTYYAFSTERYFYI